MMGPACEAIFTSSQTACSVFLKCSKLLGPNPLDSTFRLGGLLKLQDTQDRDKAVPTHSPGSLNLDFHLAIYSQTVFKHRQTLWL